MHMLVHDPISLDNNIRENLLAKENSQNTSRHSCQKRITEIFSCNGMPLISEGFQCSDQSSLLFYHSRHGSQTDQSRYKEEDHREHFTDRAHTVRVITVSCIFRQIGSVIDIPYRHLQIINLLFRIRKLLLRIGDLLLAVRNLSPGFRFTFVIVLPAICYFLFCIRQLSFRIRDLLLAGSNLFPAAVNLRLP